MPRQLLDLLVPPACLACRASVRSGEALCRRCRVGMPWLFARRCARCGLPLPCGPRCPARGAAFSRSWAPVAFDGSARTLVHALKLRGATAAAGLMAAQIVAGVPPGLMTGGSLVPVPAHPARRRARGMDHTLILARALGRRTGVGVVRCLERAAGSPQIGAGRAERLRRGRIVVGVRAPPPERAVLVDDVHTTGATLDACARALRGAGSDVVVAVTYARTLG